jgi:hypothetical protein
MIDMAGYYDIVLGMIPLALAGIATTLFGAGFEGTTAVTLGSVVAVALIGHALFVNGPVSLDTSDAKDPSANDSFQPAD